MVSQQSRTSKGSGLPKVKSFKQSKVLKNKFGSKDELRLMQLYKIASRLESKIGKINGR